MFGGKTGPRERPFSVREPPRTQAGEWEGSHAAGGRADEERARQAGRQGHSAASLKDAAPGPRPTHATTGVTGRSQNCIPEAWTWGEADPLLGKF